MLGLVCVEGVGGDGVVALHQLELTHGHHEVFVLLLHTYAAAVHKFELSLGLIKSILRSRTAEFKLH